MDSNTAPETEKRAVVLLSGGLDSTTTLAIARADAFSVYALTFDYGQKNSFEIVTSKTLAEHFQVAEHKIVRFDLRAFGGSSLTSEQAVERNREPEQIGQAIPSTYVPVRNTLFLSYALAWAEILGICDIFIGVNAVDTSGYPDCRPEFISAYEKLANLATKMGTEQGRKILIHTPLQYLSKSEIVARGIELGVDYSMTNTCYDPLSDGTACGTCDACVLRQKGFMDFGMRDPLPYAIPL